MNNLTNIESVDIILPNYNKGDFIEESVNSIINQTYKDWHLYIIDDNSTDNSKNVINKFSDLKNITIINLKKNKGPSFCRNYGMRISKSKFIAFIDSDDSWQNNKLEKQIKFMINNNLTFTFTDYTPFFEKNGKKKFKKRTYIQNYFNFDAFIKNSSINTSTMIINRLILKTTRFEKIELEDYLFKCKLFKSNATATKLAEDLAFYRIIEKSRSSRKLKNIYWLWYINKNYNKLSFFKNLISILCISINSIKKYGFK
jgi:teichuronic acid biosynthesis glycosyltransferase TuaG